MLPFAESGIFDDVIIILAVLRGKFYMYLVKCSIRVILAKNYENILKFVKVIYSKP